MDSAAFMNTPVGVELRLIMPSSTDGTGARAVRSEVKGCAGALVG